MTVNGLEFRNNAELQFRRVQSPGTIDRSGEITEVSADGGKKWQPYGLYWRNLHIFVASRNRKSTENGVSEPAPVAAAAHY